MEVGAGGSREADEELTDSRVSLASRHHQRLLHDAVARGVRLTTRSRPIKLQQDVECVQLTGFRCVNSSREARRIAMVELKKKF